MVFRSFLQRSLTKNMHTMWCSYIITQASHFYKSKKLAITMFQYSFVLFFSANPLIFAKNSPQTTVGQSFNCKPKKITKGSCNSVSETMPQLKRYDSYSEPSTLKGQGAAALQFLTDQLSLFLPRGRLSPPHTYSHPPVFSKTFLRPCNTRYVLLRATERQ